MGGGSLSLMLRDRKRRPLPSPDRESSADGLTPSALSSGEAELWGLN